MAPKDFQIRSLTPKATRRRLPSSTTLLFKAPMHTAHALGARGAIRVQNIAKTDACKLRPVCVHSNGLAATHLLRSLPLPHTEPASPGAAALRFGPSGRFELQPAERRLLVNGQGRWAGARWTC